MDHRSLPLCIVFIHSRLPDLSSVRVMEQNFSHFWICSRKRELKRSAKQSRGPLKLPSLFSHTYVAVYIRPTTPWLIGIWHQPTKRARVFLRAGRLIWLPWTSSGIGSAVSKSSKNFGDWSIWSHIVLGWNLLGATKPMQGNLSSCELQILPIVSLSCLLVQLSSRFYLYSYIFISQTFSCA